jgi:phosphonate transport system substrate-binding protein
MGGHEMRGLLFASLMADNTAEFCRALAAYLGARLGHSMHVLDDLPWQECEQRLCGGQADLGVVCGLQYVYSIDRGDAPGIDLLVAPVMRGPRYMNRPIYFSEVVVRYDHPARSLGDLRGAIWAYNEPTSHSGYALTRCTLATRGERAGFFGQVIASGAHLRSLELLLDGAIDATAIDSTVLDQELRRRPGLTDQVRIIETLGPSPIPPLVVSRALEASVREAIRSAVLSMHTDGEGGAILASAAIKQFVTVSEADYEPIRQMARMANQTEPWLSTGQLAGSASWTTPTTTLRPKIPTIHHPSARPR